MEIDKNDLKFIWKYRGPRIARTTLKTLQKILFKRYFKRAQENFGVLDMVIIIIVMVSQIYQIFSVYALKYVQGDVFVFSYISNLLLKRECYLKKSL